MPFSPVGLRTLLRFVTPPVCVFACNLHRQYKAYNPFVIDTQVPENLSDIERATTLLSGGYPQQQKSVIDRCVLSPEPV